MPINERALNAYIAQDMEELAPPNYRVNAELPGQGRLAATTPDIVVSMPYGLKTIVETEYGSPALKDAAHRLGYEFKEFPLPIKSVIAVGIPRELGELGKDERHELLMSDEPRFLMQVVTGEHENDPNITITPERPVPVSLHDIVQYAWLAAVPESHASNVIRNVVRRLQAAKIDLSDRLTLAAGPDAQAELIGKYGNHDSGNGLESVAGNVVGTLASMIQLHMNLKEWGSIDHILHISSSNLYQEFEPYDGIPYRIAAEWRKIEAVDYMPLSTIAAEMLEHHELAPKLGRTLSAVHKAVSAYAVSGVSVTTNVTAEIWQSLIPDRDERAAYYTKPATAELLANITTARLSEPAKASYNEICAGTGTIARAVEENIRFRHYATAKDKSSIHAERMERYIQLTDINPQSISVATANMISLEPETPYDSSIMFAITSPGGSLNFLDPKGVSNGDEHLVGQWGAVQAMLVLDPSSVGICCNNDPYFRSHYGGEKSGKSPIGSEALRRYKQQADRRVKGVANGMAGLATFMHVIEHAMLAPGGPHGKVLPMTAAHGQSYTGFRRNIENEYRDIIAISTTSGDGISMSADTSIQEMLLIGTKRNPNGGDVEQKNGDRAVTCVNLTRTFETKLEAKMFADAIRREVEQGRHRGEIVVGTIAGTYFRMEDLGEGKPWSVLGVSGDVASLIDSVTRGRTWNPRTHGTKQFDLPMTVLSSLAAKGPTENQLGCISGSLAPRGAFTMHPAAEDSNRINPSLWRCSAEEQVRVTCAPTHYGVPRSDPEEADRMLKTAGHFHFSMNLALGSQTVVVAYTEDECMGGRAWNTLAADPGVAEAIALFLNSSYGLLVRVGHGQTSQTGRSIVRRIGIDNHPIPDFASPGLSGRAARKIALQEFDRLRNLPLERISLSAIDDNRAEIDRVVTLMLGLPWNMDTENMLAVWRKLMCLQPAVNAGNKSTLETLAKAGIVR